MKINSSKVVISLIVTVEPIDNSIPSDLPISLPANKIPEQREKLTVLVSTGKLKEALGSQLINRRNPFQMRLWRNVINCTRLTTWRKTNKTLIIIELFDAQQKNHWYVRQNGRRGNFANGHTFNKQGDFFITNSALPSVAGITALRCGRLLVVANAALFLQPKTFF